MPIPAARVSSQTVEHSTPQDLFDELDREFHFTLDVCAGPENTKVARFHDTRDLWSALTKPWTGSCWMNPPYGRQLGHWVKKAWESSLEGATVVCLLPSRTDVKWWHEYCIPHGEIRFVRGRLKFNGAKDGAPFPSTVVIFSLTKERGK